MSEIVDQLKLKQIKTVLLVSDKMVRQIGLTKTLEELIINSNINLVIYDEVEPNPTSNNVENGANLYKKHSCEAIIAFGGGSPIDCAKAIGARIACPKKSLKKRTQRKVQRIKRCKEKHNKFFEREKEK